MSRQYLGAIHRVVGGQWLQQSADLPITDLLTDTRLITIGEQGLFFAIQGANHDGHDFISEAYAKGVRSFVVDKNIDTTSFAEANFIKVEDSLEALQRLAANHRKQFSYPVIAITGSNGKTIVKEWLSAILAHNYYLVKSPKSYNSQLGVPLSLWQMDSKHQLGVFEAGISKKGEMERLASMIRPEIGIFTNLGSAHDEGFTSRQEKLHEKLQLFKNSAVIIYRKDQETVSDQIENQYADRNLISWSMGLQESTYSCSVTEDIIEIMHQNEKFVFPSPFTEAPLQENLIFCLVTALHLGVSKDVIAAEVSSLKPLKMRLELKQGIQQTYIIDDTYNNDLKGLEIALQFLIRQKQYNKHTVILSSVFQSGLTGKELYLQVNQLLERHQIDRLIGVGADINTQSHLFTMPFEGYADTNALLSHMPQFSEEVVLVKGARHFNLEKVVNVLQLQTHRTRLVINLEHMVHNLNFYREKLSRSTRLMVMVKALAYGSGSTHIAQVLQHQRVDYLGVAYPDEAVELRKNGIATPIMVMNADPVSFDQLLQYNIEPEIFSMSQLKAWISFTQGKSNATPIHLKIETGMHRLGFESSEIDELIALIKENDLKVASIFSHLAAADDEKERDFTLNQAKAFEKASERILSALDHKPLRHLLNSPGIINYPQYQFDMVRLGIGLHGYDSLEQNRKFLKPVAHLISNISQIKHLKKGDTVSYGRLWKAEEDKTIATVAVGYADGFSRAFSKGIGKMYINGKWAPVVGSVCMDMTMVDVTHIDCQEGDEVVIFGEKPRIEELSEWIGTIPYEILTSVSVRVPRIYTSE